MNLKRLSPFILIPVAAFFLYSLSFRNPFVYDDESVITSNDFIKDPKNIPGLFTKDYFKMARERAYRPVTTLSFFSDFALWKLNVTGWRLTNVLLHGSNGVLLYLYARRFLSPSISLLAAISFIVHPVNTEAVCGISFREDLLCLFFSLLTLLFYGSKNLGLILPMTSFLLALFSKEMAIALPLIISLQELLLGHGMRKRSAPFWIISTVFAFLRLSLFAPDYGGKPSYLGDSLLLQGLAFPLALFHYMRLLIFPFSLCLEYPPNQFQVPPFTANFFLSLGVLALLVFLCYKIRRDRAVLCFICCFFASLLPVSGIVPFGAFIAERYLYLPSIFFFLLLGYWMQKLGRAGPGCGTMRYALLILTFWSVRTMVRTTDWRDETRLWAGVVKRFPRYAKANWSLGFAHFQKGELTQAQEWYQEAMKLNPASPQPYFSLGNLYIQKKEFRKARVYFQKAIAVAPGDARYYNSLGIASENLGLHNEARRHYQRAIELNPRDAFPYVNLGNLFLKRGRKGEAVAMYKKALAVDPLNWQALHNLRAAETQRGK